MKYFLYRLFLFLWCVPVYAFGDAPRSVVLLVYDSGDTYAISCFKQIIVTLEYNRIPYTTYDLSATTALPRLDTYLAVATATELLWKLDPAACSELINYVNSGGGLAVLYRAWNPHLRDLLGIQNISPPVVNGAKDKGLIFTRELIPGINGIAISTKILPDISAYDIKTIPAASVFAITAVDDLPAAWVNTVGKGTVVFWNCTILSEKIYRGLIIPSLSAVLPATFSLIMNLGVVCLDDFPLPSANAKVEPIKSEFDMSPSEFYAFRWYPDMLKLARQYGVHYTSALILGYGEVTIPPYTFIEWARSSITRGGKSVNAPIRLARLAQKDIEVGFHGQNHQPLMLSNWRSVDNMKLALNASKERWQFDNLGPAPLSYIPPMNKIDSVGINALTDVFPTIGVFGSQYMGNYEFGQNREFGTDPWNNRIISIPRLTSGYIYDDFNRFLTLSELHTVGAWTHFVHPDDVFPSFGRYAEEMRDDLGGENYFWRGGKAKNGLFYQFDNWLAFVKRYYPWLRFSDYAHARTIAKTFENSTVSVKAERYTLSLRLNEVPNYCTIHLKGKNRVLSCSGGEIVHAKQLAYSSYYVIRARRNNIVITVRDPLPTMFYRAGVPANLYIAGDSRYDPSTGHQMVLPTNLPFVAPVHPSSATAASMTSTATQTSTGMEAPTTDVVAAAISRAKNNPQSVNAWLRLREIYAETGQFDEAVRSLEHITQLLPNDTSKTKMLAREYVTQDKKEKAIPLYENILKQYDTDTETWLELFQLYSWSELPNDAIRALAGYVRAQPDNDTMMQKLAELYVGNERQMEAIPLYETLAGRMPGNKPLHLMLAQLYAWNNIHDKAGSVYEYIYRMNDADSTAASSAIAEYQVAGLTSDAARILELLLVRHPHDTALRKQLIANLLAAGKTVDAIRHCEKLIKLTPKDIPLLKQLGEMLVWQQRHIDAIGIYQRIVNAEPDSLPARIMLARLYSWNKRPREAMLEGKRILRRDQTNIEAMRFLADGYRADDNWFDARAWYSFLINRQPRDKDAREYVAEVRRNHGLLFTSAYEWIDDSNGLTREELPASVELLQSRTADYFLTLRRERVRDNRAGLSALGYGAGLSSRFTLGKKTFVTLEALATQYESNWTPITARARIEHTFGDRVSLTARIERSETIEGISALRNKMYTTRTRTELYCQATDRWSVSGLIEYESYSDHNLRSTGALLSAYKIVLRQPQIALQASSIYQDTRNLYTASQAYWTPSELFTTSAGIVVSATLFGWFTPEISEGGTMQGNVFSNTFNIKANISISQFLQLVIDYGQVGSTIYKQNIARASLAYRY